MSLLPWKRPSSEPARSTPPVAPRPTPVPGSRPTPAPSAPVVELELTEGDLYGAWRAASKRLAVRTPRPLSKGARVLVSVRGPNGGVTLLGGAVAAILRDAEVEVAVDGDRVAAVERVLAALDGRALRPRTRQTRYKLALPAVVTSASVHAYMTTFSVSLGGCGLLWSGPRPTRGSMVQVRLGSGSRSAAFHARVCWSSEQSGVLKVGLRFVVGQEAAMPPLLAQARRDAAT